MLLSGQLEAWQTLIQHLNRASTPQLMLEMLPSSTKSEGQAASSQAERPGPKTSLHGLEEQR